MRNLRNLLFFQNVPIGYKFLVTQKKVKSYVLVLNFKRLRFFPILRTLQNELFSSLSLGLLAKFFQKGKFFLKSKIVYLAVASLLRKILLFANFSEFVLIINRKPKYFNEILNSITEPSVTTYKDPFQDRFVNEFEKRQNFVFPYILFTNNKPYGLVKTKQKGRLKRKITKKIIQINKILD